MSKSRVEKGRAAQLGGRREIRRVRQESGGRQAGRQAGRQGGRKGKRSLILRKGQERERGVGNLREEGLFISQQPDAAERKLVWTINWFTQPNSQLNPSKGPLPELE